jgi:hypothetical protein
MTVPKLYLQILTDKNKKIVSLKNVTQPLFKKINLTGINIKN